MLEPLPTGSGPYRIRAGGFLCASWGRPQRSGIGLGGDRCKLGPLRAAWTRRWRLRCAAVARTFVPGTSSGDAAPGGRVGGGGRRRSPAGRSPTHRNFREPPHLPAPTRGPSEQQVKVGFGPLGKKRSSGSGVWGGDSEAPEEVPMPARCVPWPPRSLALHRDSLGPTGILGSEVPPPLCPAHAVPCQMRPQITPGLLT